MSVVLHVSYLIICIIKTKINLNIKNFFVKWAYIYIIKNPEDKTLQRYDEMQENILVCFFKYTNVMFQRHLILS